MAKDTKINLRNQCMYSIYVRNHSEEGTFKAVISDLDRIKDLGAEILWLLPIHPVGQTNKKGTLGCPYSIEDYRKVDTAYGTLEDFIDLIEEAHKRNMKLIIDVVYNHTSHNSTLYKEHPEYFYKKANGSTGNKVGDWSDIIDLDYSLNNPKQKEFWDYQIETLKYWANVGVDGFRCDVAPLVPIEFWNIARRELKEINKDIIMLAETIEPSFIESLRKAGVVAHSDSEVFEAFDISYDYDTYEPLKAYLDGKILLEEMLNTKRIQEFIYPSNYVKMRFLENHDQPRAAKLFPSEIDLVNWTAFTFFQKGISLIYAGQEFKDANLPDLFEKDLVNWTEEKSYSEFIKKLIQIKKNKIFAQGYYEIIKSKKIGVIEAQYKYEHKNLIGIFNVERKMGFYPVDLKDGRYINLIDGKEIEVKESKINLTLKPLVIQY